MGIALAIIAILILAENKPNAQYLKNENARLGKILNKHLNKKIKLLVITLSKKIYAIFTTINNLLVLVFITHITKKIILILTKHKN